MGIDGVIFDLDGTLLDTIADLAYCVNNVLLRYGYRTHPVEAYKQFIGDGMAMLIQRAVGETCSDKEITKLVFELKDEYAKNWNRETKPYPGVHDLLKELSHKKIKISVFSNKSHEFTVEMVKYYFSDIAFSTILGLQDSIPRKPDPHGALLIAHTMQLEPSQIAMIGDSATDVEMAHACGMYSIGVSWGYRPVALLLQHHPHAIANTPGDIIRIITSVT
ncbi:MAG TPA: HAD family hydrolase [Spirochaetota bacterium]|nr:HAD family hydrolase [Spirochaetota bacterium]